MAILYFAYADADTNFISQVKLGLEQFGHIVLDHSWNLDPPESSSLRLGCDGTIVFISQASAKLPAVLAEMTFAKNLVFTGTSSPFLLVVLVDTIPDPPNLTEMTTIQAFSHDPTNLVNDLNAHAYLLARNAANQSQSSQGFIRPSVDKAFWLLKMSDLNWEINENTQHDEFYFNSTDPTDSLRTDTAYFSDLHIGDWVFGYMFDHWNELVCVFEITQTLHTDPDLGAIVKFRMKYLLPTFIPLVAFQILIEITNSTDRLYPLIGDIPYQFFDLVFKYNPGLNPVASQYNNPSALIRIETDSPGVLISDQLDFQNDVLALASIIAYREVKPPLAIGLFGNWGTGKSFFMNKMVKQMEDLLKTGDEQYSPHIVPVHFNSWHYSDSNLWASLMTRIFEALKTFGAKDQDKLKTTFENLSSTKENLEKTSIEQQLLAKEIALIEAEQDKVNAEIKKAAANLTTANPVEVFKKVFKTKTIQDGIKRVNSDYAFINVKEIEEVNENIDELKGDGNKFFEAVKQAYSFRQGKAWIILLITVVLVAGLYWAFELIPFLKAHFTAIRGYIIIISVATSQFLILIKPAMKVVNRGYNSLVELKQVYDSEVKREIEADNPARDAVQKSLEEAQSKELALKLKFDELSVRKQALETEIADIQTGKKISSFIVAKVSDTRYASNLGIISWVRQDFEQLSYLLKEQFEAENLNNKAKEKFPNALRIDRIVLYIDDLDRCDAEIVVQVLEAIHLLMAFSLFVVVVGVDPRWMHRSLEKKYKDQLSDQPSTDGHPTITSFDYLEKIFQIPFQLKPIGVTGIWRLIGSQFPAPPVPTEKPKDPIPHPPATIKTGQFPPSTPDDKPANDEVSETDHFKREPNAPLQKQDRKTAQLIISAEEVTFMQSIGFLIGNSPRAVKRYINIYRVIRIHGGFRYNDTNRMDYYAAAMVMLAMITAVPADAKAFFDGLNNTLETVNFETFLKTLIQTTEAEGNIDSRFKWLSSQITGNPVLTILRNVTLTVFNLNKELVCRFSFRGL